MHSDRTVRTQRLLQSSSPVTARLSRVLGIASSSTMAEETEARWHVRVFAPIPALAGWVRALTWYQESWPGSISRRQVAMSGAVMFLNWDAPLEVRFRVFLLKAASEPTA